MHKEYLEKYPNGVSLSCLKSYFSTMYQTIVSIDTKSDYCTICFDHKL